MLKQSFSFKKKTEAALSSVLVKHHAIKKLLLNKTLKFVTNFSMAECLLLLILFYDSENSLYCQTEKEWMTITLHTALKVRSIR